MSDKNNRSKNIIDISNAVILILLFRLRNKNNEENIVNITVNICSNK
jgi:hypothetical protein